MSTARFITGDTLEQLAKLPDASVDLVLSSPPFLALRSYLPDDHPDKTKEIGSEATPGEFLDTILDVVEACARVLTPHGSLVFEFGDSYSGSGGAGGDYSEDGLREGQNAFTGTARRGKTGWPLEKSLTCIPALFQVAMAYGFNPLTGRKTDPWRVRNLCPWVRPNPPVGALGDKFRPGTSYLTVACKARDRWFDLDAVRQPYSENTNARVAKGVDQLDRKGKSADRDGNWASLPERDNDGAGAPPLDWFNIPTQPYAGSHYATWPEKLALPFIESMCPRQVCNVCGEPRRRITEATYEPLTAGGRVRTKDSDTVQDPERVHQQPRAVAGLSAQVNAAASFEHGRATKRVETLGWSNCACECASCYGAIRRGDVFDCTHRWRNGLVLDPFAGSGTTLQVATGCGRDAIGIDLDERNLDLARQRIGMFLVEEPAA